MSKTTEQIKQEVLVDENLIQFNADNFPVASFGMGGKGAVFYVVSWQGTENANVQLWKDGYSSDDLEAHLNYEQRAINASLFRSNEGKAYKFPVAYFAEEVIGAEEEATPTGKVTIPAELMLDAIEVDDEYIPEEKTELDTAMENAMAADDDPTIEEGVIDDEPEVVDEPIPPTGTVIEEGKTGMWDGQMRSKKSKFYDYLYWHGPVLETTLLRYMDFLGIGKSKDDALKLMLELQKDGWDVRCNADGYAIPMWSVGPMALVEEPAEYVIRMAEVPPPQEILPLEQYIAGYEKDIMVFAEPLLHFAEAQVLPPYAESIEYKLVVASETRKVEAVITVSKC